MGYIFPLLAQILFILTLHTFVYINNNLSNTCKNATSGFDSLCVFGWGYQSSTAGDLKHEQGMADCTLYWLIVLM